MSSVVDPLEQITFGSTMPRDGEKPKPIPGTKIPPRRNDLSVWVTHGDTVQPLSDTNFSQPTERNASPSYSPFELDHLRIVLRTSTGDSIDGILDTASGATLISRTFLTHYYPGLVHHQLETPIHLTGVGNGPTITHEIDLPVDIPDDNRQSWTACEKAYVVDGLSCGILLGLPFLKRHQLHIQWGPPSQNESILIADTGRKIRATCCRDPFAGRRTSVLKARKEYLVLPGHGVNIEVRSRELPVRAEGYLIKPEAITDPRGLTYGSLINGITDGAADILPFSNFGDCPITIRKNQVLGHLQALSIAPDIKTFLTQREHTLTAIPLSRILGDMPPEEEEEKIPDGHPFNLPIPDPKFDIDKADIDPVWGPDMVEQVRQTILRHSRLFRSELGHFNDGVEMEIPFKPDVNLDDLIQRPYNMSRRDRQAFDGIVDELVKMGVVEKVKVGENCAAAAPAFVVWRNNKPRVVVDLRKVNTKLVHHGYPLPRQDDILGSLGGSQVFTIMDMLKGFFQQPIAAHDRWKTTFVTPHRGLERMAVATMGLTISPPFFQHRMETLFGSYLWLFVLVYIDDIIVFSKCIQDHLQHLELVFTVLENSGCTMSLPKCHFAQAGLEALGHYVSRLGLSTTEEKTEAIRNLLMPSNLQDLEHGSGLMGYYRDFVPDYAILADPLNELKTLGFKGSPRANPQRDTHARHYTFPPRVARPPADAKPEQIKEWEKKQHYCDDLWSRAVKAWDKLKTALVNCVDLAFPDYSKPFILYVDTSGKGIGASLHQIQSDGKSRPILFLSRTLTSAEKNYFAPELETLGLVWALEKCSHYLDHSRIQVITDHKSIEHSFKAAARFPRNTRRLTKWQLFLAQYADKITIVHRPGKSHTNVDALSRLPKIEPTDPVKTLMTMTEPIVRSYVVTRQQSRAVPEPESPHARAAPTPTTPTPQITITPPTPPAREDAMTVPVPMEDVPLAEVAMNEGQGRVVAQLRMSSAFEEDLVRALRNDRTFRSIYARLSKQLDDTKDNANGPELTLHNFHIHPKSRLLYYLDKGMARLVIPASRVKRVLRLAHDDRAHVGKNRTLRFLRDVAFFPRMGAQVHDHVTECATCGARGPTRRLPFGDLQPIETPVIPLSVLCLDFIVGLPRSTEGHDCILLITCKTSKFIRGLIGGTEYDAEDWAKIYIAHVYPDWGLPDVFISDMDSKFLSALWRGLCEAANVDIRMTAANHAAANGQAERSVQTVVQGLVSYLGALWDPSSWERRLPHVLFVMNTSESASTKQIPFVMLYGRLPRGFLPAIHPASHEFGHTQQVAREEAAEHLQVAQAKMKAYYDDRHRRPPALDKDDFVYVKLAKPGHRGYHLNHQTKLSFRHAGPYRVVEKISPLRYRLELPDWLRWSREISIEHLHPASPEQALKTPPSPGPLTIDDKEKFIVDSILSHGMLEKPGDKTKHLYYEVKWMNYEGATWEPHDTLSLDVPQIVSEYRKRHGLKKLTT